MADTARYASDMPQNLPAPPAGVSKSAMWSRLVRSERKSKALGTRSGNPINISEFGMDAIASTILGVVQARYPQTETVGGIDGKVVVTAVSLGLYFAMKKPPKILGTTARASFYPWAYQQGRELATRF